MSYNIYTTDGVILKSTPFGEANILLHILTMDLGLIMASARSARLTNSKLGSSLQEYSDVTLSAIHSKNGWKLTSVSYKRNFFFDVSGEYRRVIAQVSSVLVKMIPGEAPHPEIFKIVKTGFEYLGSISKESISNFEYLVILRLLYQLGYVVKDNNTGIFLDNPVLWNNELLNKVKDRKKILIELANKAFKASHL